MLARDAILAAVLILSATVFLTNHALLAIGLIRLHRPRWQVWFLLLPLSVWLAPYWGFREGLPWKSRIWIVSALVYLAALASDAWLL
jgi:hypothetical protein